MDVLTNTFCAVSYLFLIVRLFFFFTYHFKGGNVLGNGTWVNVGGNQAVTYGGEPAAVQNGSEGPYRDPDGRQS